MKFWIQIHYFTSILVARFIKGSEVQVGERFLKARNYNGYSHEDLAAPNEKLQLEITQETPYVSIERKPALEEEPDSVLFPVLEQNADKYKTVNPPKFSSVPKNYAFSYAVRDKSSGDDFSHSQAHNGLATKGEYRVRLPDGRIQIVSYTADNNGYRADVRYDVDPSLNEYFEKKPSKKPLFNFEEFRGSSIGLGNVPLKNAKPLRSSYSRAPQLHQFYESQIQNFDKTHEDTLYPQNQVTSNYNTDYNDGFGSTQLSESQNSVEEVNRLPETRHTQDSFQNGYQFPYQEFSQELKYSEASLENHLQNELSAEEPVNNHISSEQGTKSLPATSAATDPIQIYPVYYVPQPNYQLNAQMYPQNFVQSNSDHQRQHQVSQMDPAPPLQPDYPQHHSKINSVKQLPEEQNYNRHFQHQYAVPELTEKSMYVVRRKQTEEEKQKYQTTADTAPREQTPFQTILPPIYRQFPNELPHQKAYPDLKQVPEEHVKIQPNSEPHEDTSQVYAVPSAAKSSNPAVYSAHGNQEVSIVKSISATLTSNYATEPNRFSSSSPQP